MRRRRTMAKGGRTVYAHTSVVKKLPDRGRRRTEDAVLTQSGNRFRATD
jgi:hypothetical protein